MTGCCREEHHRDDRTWVNEAIRKVEADSNRSADTHLHVFPLPAGCAYRTEDYDGVRDFARGCMRTYLILKERAARWNADPEIQAILQVATSTNGLPSSTAYSHEHRTALLAYSFDRQTLRGTGLAYERLDQWTIEVLLGIR